MEDIQPPTPVNQEIDVRETTEETDQDIRKRQAELRRDVDRWLTASGQRIWGSSSNSTSSSVSHT